MLVLKDQSGRVLAHIEEEQIRIRPKDLFYRASGDCVCDICGKEYLRHPLDRENLSGINQEPYLNKLCNGDLVKL